MSLTNNCPDCGSLLGKDAYKCRCGWKSSASRESRREIIPCAYTDCVTPALARVHTKTGWANVCERHYSMTNFTRPVANSPVVTEVLKAYRASKHYRDRHPSAEVEREPGADDEVVV